MPSVRFSYDLEQLRDIASTILDYAKTRGATSSETEVSEGFGQTVTVRCGEVETIEYNRDKGIGVTVYVGQQRGHASSSDFSRRLCATPSTPHFRSRALPRRILLRGLPIPSCSRATFPTSI